MFKIFLVILHFCDAVQCGQVVLWVRLKKILISCFRNCDKPRLIEALKTKRIRDIACGSSHSAAITSSGELYSWGLGEYGRLGHGDNTTQLRPKLVCVYDLPLVFPGTTMGLSLVMCKIIDLIRE